MQEASDVLVQEGVLNHSPLLYLCFCAEERHGRRRDANRESLKIPLRKVQHILHWNYITRHIVYLLVDDNPAGIFLTVLCDFFGAQHGFKTCRAREIYAARMYQGHCCL